MHQRRSWNLECWFLLREENPWSKDENPHVTPGLGIKPRVGVPSLGGGGGGDSNWWLAHVTPSKIKSKTFN